MILEDKVIYCVWGMKFNLSVVVRGMTVELPLAMVALSSMWMRSLGGKGDNFLNFEFISTVCLV